MRICYETDCKRFIQPGAVKRFRPSQKCGTYKNSALSNRCRWDQLFDLAFSFSRILFRSNKAEFFWNLHIFLKFCKFVQKFNWSKLVLLIVLGSWMEVQSIISRKSLFITTNPIGKMDSSYISFRSGVQPLFSVRLTVRTLCQCFFFSLFFICITFHVFYCVAIKVHTIIFSNTYTQ